MNKLLLSLPLLLAACAPTRTQPTTTGDQSITTTYEAAPQQVFNDILFAIRTDAGVPGYRPRFTFGNDLVEREASGPWTVSSVPASGTITAEAKSPRVTTGESDVHRLNVAVAGTVTPLRTQVVLRFTERARPLAEEINARLGAKYNRLSPTR